MGSWIAAGCVPLALAAAMAEEAAAAGLAEAWRAAAQNDKTYAVERAAHESAQPRRDQAAALWRPGVTVTASVGVASNETDTRGAQFAAPGFGTSSGVGFSTSVVGGMSSRWAVAASQPLYNPERRAQQRQLDLSATAADLQWQGAAQSLILRTAERYFDLALAQESVRVLRLQLSAVQALAAEADDRFRMGASPVTATHESKARLASVRAQLVAAESELQLKRNLLADSTGENVATLEAMLPLPSASSLADVRRPLEPWLGEAQTGNLEIRSRRLALEVAQHEASKFSRTSSTTVELVAMARRDRLHGSGAYGTASSGSANGMLGIQVSVPLFTGGYREAKELEALRQVAKAEAEVEQAAESVTQRVRASWLGLSVGAERVRALEEAFKASVSRRGATRVGVQVGERTTQDLLNAENDVAAAQLAVAQGRVGMVLDHLRLSALTGRLDEPTLRELDTQLGTSQDERGGRP